MDRTRDHKGLTWHTALSCDGGACVQVAATEHGILLGNSRQPRWPVLSYTSNEWHEFVAGIKKGDFDDLLKWRAATCSDDTTAEQLAGKDGYVKKGKKGNAMSEKRVRFPYWKKVIAGVAIAASAVAAAWMHVPSTPPPGPTPACIQIVNSSPIHPARKV